MNGMVFSCRGRPMVPQEAGKAQAEPLLITSSAVLPTLVGSQEPSGLSRFLKNWIYMKPHLNGATQGHSATPPCPPTHKPRTGRDTGKEECGTHRVNISLPAASQGAQPRCAVSMVTASLGSREQFEG